MLHDSKWRRIAVILTPILWGTFTVMGPAAMAQMPSAAKEASFEDQFWKYLVGNNYKNWSPGPSESAEFYKGKNPHGAYLKMYVNRTAAGNIDDLAVGSVVILENYLEDQSLKTISVMYRTAGFNPTGNDWYWIEYKPDGSVVGSGESDSRRQSRIRNVSLTTSPKRMVMGKSSQCIGCHQSAAGEDFVFSNDRIGNFSPEVQEEATPKQDAGDGDFVADADSFFGSR